MTITGLILIPAALIVMFMEWRYCLYGIVILTILPAAAVLNIGSFGLQPVYFFSFLIIVRTFAGIIANREPLNKFLIMKLLPLVILFAISLIILWCALAFFAGRITVLSATARYEANLAGPFEFSRGNLTQPLYLALNVVTMYCLAHQAVRMSIHDYIRLADRAINISILLVFGFFIWEFLTQRFHIPYPSGFLYSNVGYAVANTQNLSDNVANSYQLIRMSGSFSEPASAAYFLIGCLFYTYRRCYFRAALYSLLLTILVMLLLGFVVSTTGYLALVVLGTIALFSQGRTLFGRLSNKEAKFSREGLILFAIVGVAAISSVVLALEWWGDIRYLLSEAFFRKEETVSFRDRINADIMAMEIFAQTFGIGIGLGSHKGNSLFTTLLSNVGIGGAILIFVFFYAILATTRDVTVKGVLSPLKWYVAGLLIAHSISNPNLNSASLWVACGLLLGALAIMHHISAMRPGPHTT